MFSNLRNKEYKESELSDILRVKVVVKSILPIPIPVDQRQAVFVI